MEVVLSAKRVRQETLRLYGKGYCTLQELVEGADTLEKRLFASLVILDVCRRAGYDSKRTAEVMRCIKKETGIMVTLPGDISDEHSTRA
jgi:hypothetical protein